MSNLLLKYVGDGLTINGVPAYDLYEGDIARLVKMGLYGGTQNAVIKLLDASAVYALPKQQKGHTDELPESGDE